MFMEPFLDNSVHVAWGFTLLKKSFHRSASMLLRMHLIGNSTLLSCGTEPSHLFYQGSKFVPQGKKTTHHPGTAWCVAWLMHVLMWIFLHTLSFHQSGTAGTRVHLHFQSSIGVFLFYRPPQQPFQLKEVELYKVTGCIASLGYVILSRSIVFMEH